MNRTARDCVRVNRLMLIPLFLGLGILPAAVEAQSAMGPPPGLLILPITTPPDSPAAAFPAEQLRQILTVRLVNRGIYRVVSPLAVETVLQQEELLPADLADPAVLRRVAERLGVEYVLYHSLSVSGAGGGTTGDGAPGVAGAGNGTGPGADGAGIAGTGMWALYLENPREGRVVWSTIEPVDPGRPMEAVRKVTEELDTFGRDVRLVQLGDIRRLLDAGEVARAETLYHRFIETRPATPETEELSRRINELRGDEYYRAAREYAELWLFEDAFVAINRALALQPDREELREYIHEIRRLQGQAQEAHLREYVAVVTELLDEGYYDSAAMVLDSRDWRARAAAGGTEAGGGAGAGSGDGDAGEEPPEIVELRRRVEEALGARKAYRDALAAYWRGEYDLARGKVRSAVARVPDRPEYGRLLDAIDRAAANRTTSDLIWEGYRTRLAGWSLQGALIGPVDITPHWEVSAGSGSFDYRDTETLKETTIDQLVLAGSYRRPYLLQPGQRTPVVSLHAGWHGGASIRGGSDEGSGDSGVGDGSRRVNAEGVWSVAVTGGGYVQARLLAFSVESGVEVDNHLLVVTRLDRDPSADRDRSTVDVAWMPGVNWFIGGGWHWNDENRVMLRYTRTLVSAVVPTITPGTERYGTSSLVIGYARSLR
ncbi:MAG: tetratricopeptide repeat protein [Alkalispirochaeta sp.]